MTTNQQDPHFYESQTDAWLDAFDKRMSQVMSRVENGIVTKLGVWMALNIAIWLLLLEH
jgi:hypothetical protein